MEYYLADIWKSVLMIMVGKKRLVLYVAGTSSRTARAIDHLKTICDGSSIEFEIVDIIQNPDIAEKEKVFATPMLVRTLPLPKRRIVGDLRDTDFIRQRLDLCSGSDGTGNS